MRNIIFLLPLLLISCPGNKGESADNQIQKQTEALMRESVNATGGLPAIRNWTEKKLIKWIYELRDESDLATWTYVQDLQGNLRFIGRSIGYGIPASVQYSNPEKLIRADLGQYDGNMTMPQPEPNGLFMPDGLSATWIIMIDPRTKKPRPIYFEPTIVVSPFPLENAIYPSTTSYEKEIGK